MAMLPEPADYRRYHPAYFEGALPIAEEYDLWRGHANWTGNLRECQRAYTAAVQRDAPSFDEVFLALVHVHARSFGDLEMVPFLDMANGGDGEEVNVEPHEPQGRPTRCCFRATRDILAGEELVSDYEVPFIAPLTSFHKFGFHFKPGYHRSAHSLSKEANVVRYAVAPDECKGLRPHEFPESDLGADPILHSYRRFASAYCGQEDRHRSAPIAHEL